MLYLKHISIKLGGKDLKILKKKISLFFSSYPVSTSYPVSDIIQYSTQTKSYTVQPCRVNSDFSDLSWEILVKTKPYTPDIHGSEMMWRSISGSRGRKESTRGQVIKTENKANIFKSLHWIMHKTEYFLNWLGSTFLSFSI